MIPFSNAVFFLAFRRAVSSDGSTLKFVEDIGIDEELLWPNTGIFVFLRQNENRGKSRQLVFPVVIGFGEQAREVTVLLRSMYREMGNSNKFVCDANEDVPFVGGLTFSARRLPEPYTLEGDARAFLGHNLWELVPDNRSVLERLWREQKFYFYGFGKGLG